MTYKAYKELVSDINSVLKKSKSKQITLIKESEYNSIKDQEISSWKANGIDVDKYFLVAVPGILLTVKQLKNLAIKFGEKQPYSTYIYDKLYDKYTSKELCGDSDTRFILISKKYDVPVGTVEDNKQWLSEQPEYFKVPSVFESIGLWYSLRESGELKFNKTWTRHFDLQPKSVDGFSYVPMSYVYGDGKPDLNESGSGGRDRARVAVGSTSNLDSSLSSFDLTTELKKLTDKAYNQGFNDAVDSITLPEKK